MIELQHPILGEIEVGGQIGRGAFSTIFKAFCKNLRFLVCLKVPKTENDKNTEEYEVQKACNHALCCQYIGNIEFENQDAAILQYIDGITLLNDLRYTGAMPEKKAKVMFAQICHTIQYLHKNKIVHRDLKLENIMLDRNGIPHIIDFGFSRFIDKNKPKTKDICGSLNYLSPEIIQYGSTSFSNDVWALGVILYAMIFARLPFDGPDNNTIIKCILWKSVDTSSLIISEELQNLIDGMLQKDVEDRLTLDEVLKHPWLRDVVNGSGFKMLDSMLVFPRCKEEIDVSVINEMEKLGVKREIIEDHVLNRKDTKDTMVYFTLRMQSLSNKLASAKAQMVADAEEKHLIEREGVSLPNISSRNLSHIGKPSQQMTNVVEIRQSSLCAHPMPRTKNVRFRVKANSVAPDKFSQLARRIPITLIPQSPIKC